MNRGSMAPEHPEKLEREASMRPRFMNRGSRAAWVGAQARVTLQ